MVLVQLYIGQQLQKQYYTSTSYWLSKTEKIKFYSLTKYFVVRRGKKTRHSSAKVGFFNEFYQQKMRLKM